jgi:hypothetical protein
MRRGKRNSFYQIFSRSVANRYSSYLVSARLNHIRSFGASQKRSDGHEENIIQLMLARRRSSRIAHIGKMIDDVMFTPLQQAKPLL